MPPFALTRTAALVKSDAGFQALAEAAEAAAKQVAQQVEYAAQVEARLEPLVHAAQSAASDATSALGHAAHLAALLAGTTLADGTLVVPATEALPTPGAPGAKALHGGALLVSTGNAWQLAATFTGGGMASGPAPGAEAAQQAAAAVLDDRIAVVETPTVRTPLGAFDAATLPVGQGVPAPFVSDAPRLSLVRAGGYVGTSEGTIAACVPTATASGGVRVDVRLGPAGGGDAGRGVALRLAGGGKVYVTATPSGAWLVAAGRAAPVNADGESLIVRSGEDATPVPGYGGEDGTLLRVEATPDGAGGAWTVRAWAGPDEAGLAPLFVGDAHSRPLPAAPVAAGFVVSFDPTGGVRACAVESLARTPLADVLSALASTSAPTPATSAAALVPDVVDGYAARVTFLSTASGHAYLTPPVSTGDKGVYGPPLIDTLRVDTVRWRAAFRLPAGAYGALRFGLDENGNGWQVYARTGGGALVLARLTGGGEDGEVPVVVPLPGAALDTLYHVEAERLLDGRLRLSVWGTGLARVTATTPAPVVLPGTRIGAFLGGEGSRLVALTTYAP